MSDTHLCHEDRGDPWKIPVPPGDLVIHAGDGTFEGSVSEIQRWLEWFSGLPHTHKVMIAGNHDWLFERVQTLARSMLPKGVVYLQDQMVEIGGLKIYGAPWTPMFMDWAFNLDRGHRLREKWNLIPRGIDVLVTHGPPYGILDLNYHGEHVGCKDLRDVIERVRPRLHVFGHIHGAHGVMAYGGATYVNASVVNEAYKPVWKAFTIDLEPLGQPREGLVIP